MSKASDKLLPPLKVDDVFKRTRGRVLNLESKQGLSSRDKAQRLAKGYKEAVIKFDKASTGIKTKQHMMAACLYMCRHGKVELEDDRGEVLTLDEAKNKVTQWCLDQDVPDNSLDESRAADARRCIISCPPGSDPKKLKEAAREFGQEIFHDQGFEFMMAIHYKDKDHPNEPDHPHVHFLVKAISQTGERLNVRKADLRYMRERFAVIAKQYGIELNATSRAVRGKVAKAKSQAQYHEEKRRYKQSQAQKLAINRKKQKLHPYEKSRQEELLDALKSGKDLEDHPILKKAKATRNEVIKNTQDYINELRLSGKVEDKIIADGLENNLKNMQKVESTQQQKLRIARRKAAEKIAQKRQSQEQEKHKQSQAQKWAIDRKKKQLKKNNER